MVQMHFGGVVIWARGTSKRVFTGFQGLVNPRQVEYGQNSFGHQRLVILICVPLILP